MLQSSPKIMPPRIRSLDALLANRSQNHCLILQEYANQPDVYFTNDTILFTLSQVSIILNSSLQLENLNNFTLHGLPGSSEKLRVRISFEAFVAVTWEKCSNIEISSVIFHLLRNFTHVIVFNQTKTILLLRWPRRAILNF